jgi:urease accessory protein UreE
MQEYRRHPGWNQSSLKKIIGFNDNSEEEKVLPGVRKHINLGSTVDLILSYDNYRDYLYIYEEKEPSETITKIINNAQEIDPEISDDSIKQSIELCNYVGNRSWDMQRKLEEIRKNAEEYIQFRLDSINKLITSQLQLDRAEQIVSNLYTASNTKDFFNQKCIKQEEIYFTHKGLECKALLDSNE